MSPAYRKRSPVSSTTFHKKTIIKLITVLLLVVISAAIFIFGYADREGPLKEQKTIIIPRGLTVKKISDLLQNNEIISHSWLFPMVVNGFDGDKSLKAGEYLFEPGITPKEVAEILINKRAIFRKITFPEGLTTYQILRIIDENEMLTGDLPVNIAEGELFPETYYFTYGDEKSFLVERMKAKFNEVLNDLWQKKDPLIPYDMKSVVILASIVEKETSIDSERARVAAVFMNRLKKGMKLQSDPTVIYAITDGTGELGRELTKDDLKAASPFNTYVNIGLPPGPICNPGRESLAAVLSPIETEELYFVASGDGTHVFSKSLKEHNRSVQKYRKQKNKNSKSRK